MYIKKFVLLVDSAKPKESEVTNGKIKNQSLVTD
jgi:hypothetical protein